MRHVLACLLFGTTSLLHATAICQTNPAAPAPPPPAEPPPLTGAPPPAGAQPLQGAPATAPPQLLAVPPGQADPNGAPAPMPPPPPAQGPAQGPIWQAPGPQPMPPWMPPGAPPPAPEQTPGVVHGVPMSRQGRIAIDAAGFKQESTDAALLALALDVHIPVAARTFLDARLPMAGIFPGNIMLGVGRIAKLGRGGFLTYGMTFGIPLSTNANATDFSLPNGTWNVHEYQAQLVPIRFALGYERTGRLLEFRLDLEPVLLLPTSKQDVNLAFQHAAEVQVGHSFGGGLRLQGVAVTSGVFDDPYQLAIEPFVTVRRELGFARVGLMLPLDESTAGPPFKQAWGLRLMTGLHIR